MRVDGTLISAGFGTQVEKGLIFFVERVGMGMTEQGSFLSTLTLRAAS